jgi:hypothetical protein
MRLLRLATFGFLFCVDVHVKAQGLLAEDCWGKDGQCAVQAGASRRVMSNSTLRIVLAPQALLERRDPETIQLVRGDFYVESSTSVKMQTPFAKVWCVDDCKALFTRAMNGLEVKSLAGRWRVERVGEPTIYALPAGLQLVFGEVSDQGMAQMEFPQSLPWSPTLKQWAALYPDKMSMWKSEVVQFRHVWRDAVEAVSVLHQTAANRAVAAHDKEVALARQKRLAQLREDEGLRELFRSKNP